jgi:hypothetical protein
MRVSPYDQLNGVQNDLKDRMAAKNKWEMKPTSSKYLTI